MASELGNIINKIQNNSTLDPVREAILKVQENVDSTGAGVGAGILTIDTDNALTGGSVDFSANQSGNASITIGLENTIPGDRTFSGNIVVSGNFTVNGTTTYLNTQQVEVEDNIIELNRTQGTPDTATASTSGIQIYRGDGVSVASLIFDDADDTWDFTHNVKIAGDLEVEGTISGSIEEARTVRITVKNTESVTLAKGTVVHVHPSANPPSGNVVEVKKADYDTASLMPAIGILNESLAAAGSEGDEGKATMFGYLSGIDTSSFSAGDELYVGNDGALTNTKPTGASQLIQKIAVVIKSDANNGSIEIFGAGRSNDVPNLNVTNASVSGNTLTINRANASDVTYAPSFLPLAGGSLSGDLELEATAPGTNDTSNASPNLTFTAKAKQSDGTSVTDSVNVYADYYSIANRFTRLYIDDNVNIQGTLLMNNDILVPSGVNIDIGSNSNRINHIYTDSLTISTTLTAPNLNVSGSYKMDNTDIINSSRDFLGRFVSSEAPLGAVINLRRDDNSIVADDDLGQLVFYGQRTDGNYHVGGIIKMIADATWDGASNQKSRLEIWTHNTTTDVQRLIVDTDTFDIRNSGLSISGTERIEIDGDATLKNVTAASFIKTGGTSSQFLKADGSVDSNTYLTSLPSHNHNDIYYTETESDNKFAPVKRDSVTISKDSYTRVARVLGNNLASTIRMTVHGTTANIVVNCLLDISVNHSQDIIVHSQAGRYTSLDVKIISNNNEDFDIYLQYTGSASAGTSFSAAIEVFPLNNETITFSPTATAYTGKTFTHTATPGKIKWGQTDSDPDLYVNTSRVFHDGYHPDADNADTVDNKHATDFTLDYVTDNGNSTTNSITIGQLNATGGSFTNPVTIYDLTATENPRLSLGRQAAESLRFDVGDRDAIIYHRQDETDGVHTMQFAIDSGNSEKRFIWYTRAADSTSPVELMHLDDNGLDVSGSVNISGSLFVDGTIDLSDANLDIGSADIIFGIDATDTGARGLVWNFDGDGDGNPVNIGYIRAGGTVVGEVMQFNMNADGSVTGSGTIYQFMNGGTDILTIGADGTTNFTRNINVRKVNVGIITTYSSASIEDTDAQLDIISSSSGTWGSAINLIEGASTTANTDVWSIARHTTGGSGDSGLYFNFGTGNQHDNTNRVKFSSSGDITAQGTVNSDSLVVDGVSWNSGKVRIEGTSPNIEFRDSDSASYWFQLGSNTKSFFVLHDTDKDGSYESTYPLWLNSEYSIGQLYGSRIFADNYHPNADKWTSARTVTFSGDISGSFSIDGSADVSNVNLQVANDSHTHDGRYYTETESDTRYGRKIFGDAWGDTPEAKYIKIEIPFVGGSGSSEMYFFDVYGYRDYGQMDSQLHYRVYIHARSNGTTTNNLNMDVKGVNVAANEEFVFAYKTVASSATEVYITVGEDYSGIQINSIPLNEGKLNSINGLTVSSSETAPTGQTTIIPAVYLSTTDSIDIGQVNGNGDFSIGTNDFTAGTATIGGILLQDSADRGGLLEVNRKGTNSWAGIQVNYGTNHWSFMGNANNAGLYDDHNSKWAYLYSTNNQLSLYYNGTEQARTQNGYFLATNEFRSAVFRGTNTVYHVTPAGTSNLNGLTLGSTLTLGSLTNDFTSTTALVNSGSGVVGQRSLGSGAFSNLVSATRINSTNTSNTPDIIGDIPIVRKHDGDATNGADYLSSIDNLDTFILSKTDGGYGGGTKPSGSHNGFGVISIQTHTGDYYTQLGLDTNQNGLWIRSADATTTFGSWQRTFADDYHPNADKWTTARTLTLNGDASGSVSWDGSANATLTVTVANDSHSHSNYVTTTGTDYRNGNLELYGTNTNGTYGNAPIELKEVNQVGTAQSAYQYAPAIAWHWGGRKQMQMRLHSDGHLYVDGSNYGQSKVWTAGNDGSGSGLDADTVDGLQASQFLRSDTSDTMSGDLTINPSTNYALYIGRVGGAPNIKSSDAYAFMDSNGGHAGLNWYTSDNVTLANGGGSVGIGNSSISQKLTVHGTVGATIYYDKDNTSYYANPASTSNFNALNVGGSPVLREDNQNILRYRGSITSQDWNTYIDGSEGGWFRVLGMSGSNKPPAYTYGMALSMSYSAQSKVQLYFPETGSSNNGIYVRTGWNTAYRNWRSIALHGVNPQTGGALYASNFYDSDNTSYYVNPASTSNLNSLVVASSLQIAGRNWTGSIGTGQNYVASSTSTSNRGNYGAGIWAYSGYSTGTNRPHTYDATIQIMPDSNRGFELSADWLATNKTPLKIRSLRDCCQGWSTWVEVMTQDHVHSGNFFTTGSMRAGVFYDQNDTNFYLNPNGVSVLDAVILRCDSRASSDTTHIFRLDGNYTDGRWAHRFRKQDLGGGVPLFIDFSSTTSNSYTALARFGAYSGNGYEFQVFGDAKVDGQLHAPIFYDSDNTSYYLDAASTSRLNQVDANYLDCVANNAYALRFWGGGNDYSIRMAQSSSGTWGGRMAGETTSDYNMYFTMAGGTNRGFVFNNGSANAVAGIDASGNGRFKGDVIAYASSDKRLKDNITPIENPIDKVQKISGVTFDWNDKQDTYEHGKHDVGVIAQEIEEVLPEVVDTRENGYKAVKYEKIVPLLIEAIKEQQKQIDELKSLINKS